VNRSSNFKTKSVLEKQSTQSVVQKSLLEKNYNIKQRIVNEARPFLNTANQNLYKLPQEKQLRGRMLEEQGYVENL